MSSSVVTAIDGRELHLLVATCISEESNANDGTVYYGTQYFLRAGFDSPFIIQVITNCVNVASTFPGLYMVEKLGRRNLLLLGAIGMCVCQCKQSHSSTM